MFCESIRFCGCEYLENVLFCSWKVDVLYAKCNVRVDSKDQTPVKKAGLEVIRYESRSCGDGHGGANSSTMC